MQLLYGLTSVFCTQGKVKHVQNLKQKTAGRKGAFKTEFNIMSSMYKSMFWIQIQPPAGNSYNFVPYGSQVLWQEVSCNRNHLILVILISFIQLFLKISSSR